MKYMSLINDPRLIRIMLLTFNKQASFLLLQIINSSLNTLLYCKLIIDLLLSSVKPVILDLVDKTLKRFH